jgi:hypothetical protein
VSALWAVIRIRGCDRPNTECGTAAANPQRYSTAYGAGCCQQACMYTVDAAAACSCARGTQPWSPGSGLSLQRATHI